MSDINFFPDGKLEVVSAQGYTFVFHRGALLIKNPKEMRPDKDGYVSMKDVIHLPAWLYVAVMERARETLEKENNGLTPIPPYGDLYTVEEFREMAVEGHLVDWDGSGYYATESGYSQKNKADPSAFRAGIIDKNWTHVIWFNK